MSDVWNEAAESTTGPRRYFGQLWTSANYVHIQKGDPKVPFDPTQHDIETRYAEIKIGSVHTLDNGKTFDLDRSYLTSKRKRWSRLEKDWKEIVNPSLQKLNIHPRDLNDAWASWEMVPTGRKWISNRTNEEVEGTAHKFLEFYPDEETCRAAEAAFYNRSRDETAGTGEDPLPMPEDPDKERADAAVFLPTMWTLAQGDPDAFYAAIANQPSLAKFFDSNSPEVVAIVEEAA